VRLQPTTDGALHPTDGGPNDHHARPTRVDFLNTTQSIPGGGAATYNLDVALPRSDFVLAQIKMMGAHSIQTGIWREGAYVQATTNAANAIGHSFRDSGGATKMIYHSVYSKQNGDAYLTQKVFDGAVALGADYIALLDAVIIGAVLRLTFRNSYLLARTLWVKGVALLW